MSDTVANTANTLADIVRIPDGICWCGLDWFDVESNDWVRIEADNFIEAWWRPDEIHPVRLAVTCLANGDLMAGRYRCVWGRKDRRRKALFSPEFDPARINLADLEVALGLEPGELTDGDPDYDDADDEYDDADDDDEQEQDPDLWRQQAEAQERAAAERQVVGQQRAAAAKRQRRGMPPAAQLARPPEAPAPRVPQVPHTVPMPFTPPRTHGNEALTEVMYLYGTIRQDFVAQLAYNDAQRQREHQAMQQLNHMTLQVMQQNFQATLAAEQTRNAQVIEFMQATEGVRQAEILRPLQDQIQLLERELDEERTANIESAEEVEKHLAALSEQPQGFQAIAMGLGQFLQTPAGQLVANQIGKLFQGEGKEPPPFIDPAPPAE